MVLYFSGTGNSRYAARLIAAATADNLVSIGAMIKSGTNGTFQSDRPYVFVCPTYAWRMPRVVEDFIRQASFSGSNKAYFVLSCGGEAGNAAPYAARLCRNKKLDFMGLAGVVMPENYIAMFDVPDKKEADAIIQKAVPRIQTIAGMIKDGRPLPEEHVTLVNKFRSGIVNDVFYPLYVKAKGFYATSACTGCGKCAALCPLNNITLQGDTPRWGQECTHCMACICACPCEAIEYKKASQGKPRYYLPEEHL